MLTTINGKTMRLVAVANPITGTAAQTEVADDPPSSELQPQTAQLQTDTTTTNTG